MSEHSSVAVDVTGGNAYVTTSDKILLFTPSNDVKTLLEGSDLKGQPGKIALKPSAGYALSILFFFFFFVFFSLYVYSFCLKTLAFLYLSYNYHL